MNLVYDGSFEGFLSLVYEVYYKSLHVESIYSFSSDSLLSYDAHEIITDIDKATKVVEALHVKFTKQNFELITNTFLCGYCEKELLEYIILGFKDQKHLENINISSVFKLNEIQREYFHLVHKMYGFVRFEELEDKTLYAKVKTKYNILLHVGRHFTKRLSSCNFIIHDIERSLAFVKFYDEVSIKEVSHFDEPTLSDDEEKFKKLWRVFFKSVSIKSRENKKLQQNLVPLIYRKYMSEFEH